MIWQIRLSRKAERPPISTILFGLWSFVSRVPKYSTLIQERILPSSNLPYETQNRWNLDSTSKRKTAPTVHEVQHWKDSKNQTGNHTKLPDIQISRSTFCIKSNRAAFNLRNFRNDQRRLSIFIFLKRKFCSMFSFWLPGASIFEPASAFLSRTSKGEIICLYCLGCFDEISHFTARIFRWVPFLLSPLILHFIALFFW